jgi:1A family penicillin-binding protein
MPALRPQTLRISKAGQRYERCSAKCATPVRIPDPKRLEAFVNAHRSVVLAGLIVLCLGTWLGIGASVGYVYAAVRSLPGQKVLAGAGTMARATTIADVKGRHAFTVFEEQRLQVPLSRVSRNVITAILAIEDQRFYSHSGFDPVRVVAALVNDVVKGRAEQGASTITQQLARLSFLTPDKTVRRKVQELILATRLERTFSKDQILELYLNKAYFGDGLYGVEAASLGYFGKHAADLDVSEAALIAGLVKSPSAYAPTVNASRSIARRNVVLQAMRETRAIDDRTYRAAVATPLHLNDALRREEAFGQYFKEEVRKELVERFGWDRVYRDGLRVETTLDLDMQRAAEDEVQRALATIEQQQQKRRGSNAPTTEPLQAALVALDPHTGEVRAMVGGRNFEQSHFNRATQSRRQPGSAFKPFVYAAALEQGFTPATIITGLSEPVATLRNVWLPDDAHVDGDAITMRAALRLSSNRAAVQMLQTIGVSSAVSYAQRLGLDNLPAVPSLALGSGEVTLLSLTSAYGAFANQGALATPSLIRRVTTSEGQVLFETMPSEKAAVSPTTAFLITSMLQDVVNAGTAAQARQVGFRLPAAGKTGTTNDYHDAWFVGYTPRLVTGVWVGYDQPRTIMRGGYAAELAVPLWARFMMTATRDDKPESFRAPAGIVAVDIDGASGRLATDDCRRAKDGIVYTEYFARGTEPIDICPIHRAHLLRALIPFGRPSAPVVVAQEASPPTVAEVRPAPPPPVAQQQPAPEPKKKRGFWSRVFGVGKDSERADGKPRK